MRLVIVATPAEAADRASVDDEVLSVPAVTSVEWVIVVHVNVGRDGQFT
jgi:hypothetical protein